MRLSRFLTVAASWSTLLAGTATSTAGSGTGQGAAVVLHAVVRPGISASGRGVTQ
jgi:hypothetical protein